MPEIKESDLLALQEAFLEVAFRANRLREWTLLEKHLRAVERSFSDFHNEVKKADAQPANANIGLMTDLWGNCNDMDLIDLKAFNDGLRYINRATWMDNGGAQAAAQMRVVNLSSLDPTAQGIDQDMTNVAIKPLAQKCAQFRRAINTQLAERLTTVNTEIQELCELTIRLRERLQG